MVDTFLSFPSRYALTSCATADRILWAEVTCGVVNIFAAEQGTRWYTPIQLTFFTEDAGLEVNFLQFVDVNCTSILFNVGQQAGANPLNLVFPVQNSSTYSVKWPQGQDQSPSVPVLINYHPVEGVYLGQNIYTAPNFATVDVPGLAVMFGGGGIIFNNIIGRPEGFATHPVFPSVMAFSSNRGDHAFIGIYLPNSTRLTWVSPALDFDANPVWSPDGTMLAFYRLADLTDERGFWPMHAGPPFSVLVANISISPDLASATVGAPKVVYRDWSYGLCALTGDCGYGTRPLLWTPDSKTVLFGSEALPTSPGFLHVAAVRVDGASPAVDITPLRTPSGQGCEMADWTLGPAVGSAGTLFVTHNCDSHESLSVLCVDLASGAVGNVLTGTATSIGGLASAGQGVAVARSGLAYLGSTYNTPPSIFFIDFFGKLNQTELSPLSPHRYPRFNNSAFVVPISGVLSLPNMPFPLSYQLFTPPAASRKSTDGEAPRPLPAVLFTHGGSQRQMFGAFHFSPTYAQLYATHQLLASQGLYVLSVNYRSGVGYGHAYRACDGCGMWGGAEYADVLSAGQWLGNQSFVDSAKVGLYGLSYGGLNTLQGLTRNSDVFKAGVASAPVFNWVSCQRTPGPSGLYEVSPATAFGFRQLAVGPLPDLVTREWSDHVTANVNTATQSSPSSHVGTLKSPLLLIHGDLDEEVDFQESRGMLRAARRLLGAHADELIDHLVFPDEIHGLSVYANQLRATQATLQFLKDKLV